VVSVPEHYNFAVDCIDRWARDPGRLALHWVDATGTRERKLSFAELSAASARVAGALQALGLAPGDRVKLVTGREPVWWICVLGMIRAGIIWVPGTTLLAPKDYGFRIGQAHISAAIVDPAQEAKLDAVRAGCPRLRHCITTGPARPGWLSLDELTARAPAPEPVRTRSDQRCVIYFTSGTTGHPKMVVHTHASYPLGHFETGRYWLQLTPDDLHWNLSDNGWAKAAYASLFGPWSQGAAVFVQSAEGKFDAQATLDALRRYPITSFCGPPTAFRQLIALDIASERPRALRRTAAAGEPLNPEVLEAWRRATGITIREAYGQTETTVLVCYGPDDPVRPGSMGRAAPGYEVEIVDDQLRPVPPGTEGEVAVRVRPQRPLGLFAEYENNPDENAAKFRGDYYLTGDRAVRDPDGYFYFVGRGDDVILSASYRIGPFEVESALIEHPAVLEAAVIGAPDPERYQIVKAFVVLHAGHAPTPQLAHELQEHVKRATAPYKYPREIEFVGELPKTVSGKIRRVELRLREEQRRQAAASRPG
jgi:acetyl-CoA synthetase/medium-chain acyl-CoA synthetase